MKSLSYKNQSKSAVTRGAQCSHSNTNSLSVELNTKSNYYPRDKIRRRILGVAYILTRPKFIPSMVCGCGKSLIIVTGKTFLKVFLDIRSIKSRSG